MMVQFLAMSGHYSDALKQLAWVEGSQYYAEARESLHLAMQEDERRTRELLQERGF